jgi:hypothetical protein
MPIKQSNQVELKMLNDKIKSAVVSAIQGIVGPENNVRVLTLSTDLAELLPIGQNVSLKMSIDIYPNDKVPQK